MNLHQSERLPIPITAAETYDKALLARYRAVVERAVEDTVAIISRRREIVDFEGVQDAHIRMIARNAARLAVGLSINRDRPPEADVESTAEAIEPVPELPA